MANRADRGCMSAFEDEALDILAEIRDLLANLPRVIEQREAAEKARHKAVMESLERMRALDEARNRMAGA